MAITYTSGAMGLAEALRDSGPRKESGKIAVLRMCGTDTNPGHPKECHLATLGNIFSLRLPPGFISLVGQLRHEPQERIALAMEQSHAGETSQRCFRAREF